MDIALLDCMSSPSLAPGKPCPICGKPAIDRYKPFCAGRCGDVDLNRWLSGVYAVPAVEQDEDSIPDAAPADEQDK